MASTISKINGDLSQIPDLLAKYEAKLDNIDKVFDMDGRRLEELCKEHSKNMVEYDRDLQDVKILEEFMKMKIEAIRSAHWRKYTERYNVKLTGRDVEAYIAGEEDYVTMYQIMLEVQSVKRKFEAVVEGLKNMGWNLSHITKLRVAQIEAAVI